MITLKTTFLNRSLLENAQGNKWVRFADLERTAANDTVEPNTPVRKAVTASGIDWSLVTIEATDNVYKASALNKKRYAV